MTQELVRIDFHGDTLEAVEQNGKVWVSLRRCCDNLGMTLPSQLEKLRGKAWACVTEIVTRDASGREQPAAMIDVDTLPGWLFSIDARRVAEHVREKLAHYQREAARVLADHFLRRRSGDGDAAFVTVGMLKNLFAGFRDEMSSALTASRPVAAMPPTGSYPTLPRFTVAERLRFKGWFTASKKQRHTIRRLANALLDSRYQETADLIGGTLFFSAHQLVVLDEAIDRVKADAEQAERAGGAKLPGLV